jgi:hypothetical protein
MTALIIENFAALPSWRRSVGTLISTLARSINRVVQARAARHVPEWRIREIRREIARYRSMTASMGNNR